MVEHNLGRTTFPSAQLARDFAVQYHVNDTVSLVHLPYESYTYATAKTWSVGNGSFLFTGHRIHCLAVSRGGGRRLVGTVGTDHNSHRIVLGYNLYVCETFLRVGEIRRIVVLYTSNNNARQRKVQCAIAGSGVILSGKCLYHEAYS